jgi:integrase
MLAPDYEPRLYDAGGDINKVWYIDYRIWDTDKGKFVRKRYEGLNKYHTLAGRRKQAKIKLAEIKELLAAGFTAGVSPSASLPLDMRKATLVEAVEYVLSQKALRRGVEEYNRLLRRLREYPALGGMPARMVGPVHIGAFMNFIATRPTLAGGVVGNKSFNHYRNTLSSSFNFLVKMELLPRNPCRAIDVRKVAPSAMHRPYTDAQRAAVRDELLRRGDEQLLLFISFIYYCFIRSGGELRLLRVRDLHPRTVLVPASTAKNDKPEHVTIPVQLEQMIVALGLRNYPAEYYIFTHRGHPGPKPVGPYWFPKHHRALLLSLGITDPAYTIYGYKHTGAINLYLATDNIELVRRHCRHDNAATTTNYLRGLGVLTDAEGLAAMPNF